MATWMIAIVLPVAAVAEDARPRPGVVFRDDFARADAKGWQAIRGKWEAKGGALPHADASGYGHHWAVADVSFTEGIIEVEGVVRKHPLIP